MPVPTPRQWRQLLAKPPSKRRKQAMTGTRSRSRARCGLLLTGLALLLLGTRKLWGSVGCLSVRSATMPEPRYSRRTSSAPRRDFDPSDRVGVPGQATHCALPGRLALILAAGPGSRHRELPVFGRGPRAGARRNRLDQADGPAHRVQRHPAPGVLHPQRSVVHCGSAEPRHALLELSYGFLRR